MRLGFSLPIFGRIGAEPGGIARFAQAAEAAGAASLWVGDRLLSPVNPVIGELKPVRTPPVHLAAFTPRSFRRVGERAARLAAGVGNPRAGPTGHARPEPGHHPGRRGGGRP